MQGLIIKGIGGFYEVKTVNGIYQAKGRGRFKKDGFTLAVGDNVEISLLPDGNGVIDRVFERKNQFLRPPIVNVDNLIIVFSVKDPKPNFILIDRFLIMAQKQGTEPVLCVNKCDMASPEELEKIREIYGSEYPLLFVSGKTGQGIEALKQKIGRQRVAFAGPSGVGKSTLTNALVPSAGMETGEVSTKANRGKHTTRHVQIFETEEGAMVFDTPGFTSFDLPSVNERTLMDGYPEFAPYKEKCRFADCYHLSEPDCKVREAVEQGKIHPARYASYVANMKEIQKKKHY